MITLTTDFGTADPYVAEMKGVVLAINPLATVVDVSHQIAPQAVSQGAFVLGSVRSAFPADTVHVAVVDPGVGTGRKAVLLVAPEGLFLAPDNGLLTFVLRDCEGYPAAIEGAAFMSPVLLPVPPGYSAYALSNPGLWRHPVSDTFHGRDIFAPVAAHLSLGTPPAEVGEPLDTLVCLSIPHAAQSNEGLAGHVVHVDRFGNLVSTVEGWRLAGKQARVHVNGRTVQGLSRSYAEAADLLALVGSHRLLEVAVRDGSAARELMASVGDPVVVEFVG